MPYNPKHYQDIAHIIQHIIQNKLEQKSLAEIAKSLELSPGHLQKKFVDWVGISPKQFGRYLSLEYAKGILKEPNTLYQTALKTGLSGGGRLHDLFVDIEAMTPGEYQKQGLGLMIHYSIFPTLFGLCLTASTQRGICNILFADTPQELLRDLKSRWPKAELVEQAEASHQQIQDYFLGISPHSKIKLHLAGTNFQVRVWEALLSIPNGHLSTYGRVAKQVGDAKMARAVGRVVGQNPIGYLIPCHRVLKSSGEISGYHWGVERKQAMLGVEAMWREAHHSKK